MTPHGEDQLVPRVFFSHKNNVLGMRKIAETYVEVINERYDVEHI